MRKLTYWIADCLDDSPVYSIRAKTKKEVVQKLQDLGLERGKGGQWGKPYKLSRRGGRAIHPQFGKPRKHTIPYENVHDLVFTCLDENRGSGG
jgi:hypothetical protein